MLHTLAGARARAQRAGVRSAPHHYGGRSAQLCAAGRLAAAIQGFTYVEWDEANLGSGTRHPRTPISGWLGPLPARPGLGWGREAVFERAMKDGIRRGLERHQVRCVSLRDHAQRCDVERSETSLCWRHWTREYFGRCLAFSLA